MKKIHCVLYACALSIKDHHDQHIQPIFIETYYELLKVFIEETKGSPNEHTHYWVIFVLIYSIEIWLHVTEC